MNSQRVIRTHRRYIVITRTHDGARRLWEVETTEHGGLTPVLTYHRTRLGALLHLLRKAV